MVSNLASEVRAKQGVPSMFFNERGIKKMKDIWENDAVLREFKFPVTADKELVTDGVNYDVAVIRLYYSYNYRIWSL